jgi:DNA (cytosine-5)-methyltransferase 1
LVGGTPCQSFSVAGLRKGLDDPRGNLALTYVGILDKFRPKWCVWENVPGVLSSNKGRDFGAFLGALVELGYGWSYRVLDAQNFGVAQRRRRVFVVGCLGGWESAAKVLFESESLSGNNSQSRGKGKDIANCLTKSPSSHSSYNPARGEENAIIVKWPADKASTLNASFGDKLGLENQHINSGAPLFVQSVYENHGTDSRVKEISISPTVTARWGTGGNNVPLAQNYTFPADMNFPCSFTPNISNTLVRHGTMSVSTNMAVRRLTEVEYERLQGFPDNYTNIKENCPSGARYKALGNSMAVPVMRWIGERINNYERL